jgi:hypothetical protein
MSVRGRREMSEKTMTEWADGRKGRLENFIREYRDSLEKNEVGLRFLSEIISENEDRIRIGHNNIIILGKLASYAIPIQIILQMITNPFAENSSFGLPRVEVHPRGSWIQNHTNACIQSRSGPDIPASDVIASIVMGLLSDETLYHDESQESFRTSLLTLYGLTNSPISTILAERVSSRGALLDQDEGEVRIKGTHGFTWHLGFDDPEVKSFSVSSSIRGGPRRLHMEDTYNWISDCKNIDRLIVELSLYPRGLMREHQEETQERLHRGDYPWLSDTEFAHNPAFIHSVARHFAPLEDTAIMPPSNPFEGVE